MLTGKLKDKGRGGDKVVWVKFFSFGPDHSPGKMKRKRQKERLEERNKTK